MTLSVTSGLDLSTSAPGRFRTHQPLMAGVWGGDFPQATGGGEQVPGSDLTAHGEIGGEAVAQA